MKTLWKNQFIFWNIIALILVKAVLSYPLYQFASIVGNTTPFAKEEVVSDTNTLRSSLGLAPLKENSVLDLAASDKLQDMINNQYFAHVSPAGITPWHWFDVAKYNFSYAGENLAIGFWSAQDTVNAWANSPSHRDNLLNTHYQDIGVAVAPAQIQNNQGFLVVQDFGAPAVAVAAKPVAAKTPASATKTQPEKVAVGQPTSIIPAPAKGAPVELPIPTATSLQPTIVNSAPAASNADLFAKILNGTFALYALLIFLVSVLFIIFTGIRKTLIVRAAVGIALIILVLTIPAAHLTYTALIF